MKTTEAIKNQVNEHPIKLNQKSRSKWAVYAKNFKKNKRAMIGLFIVVIFLAIVTFAPWIATHDPFAQNASEKFQSPSLHNLFGTDRYGRDIFSRIIYGSRISLAVGFFGVCISILIGVFLGTVSGYFGGKVDTIIMRFIDILMSFPGFLLALAIIAILGPGMTNVIVAIGIFSIPGFSRITRSNVIPISNTEYVEAARAMGSTHASNILKHVIPNSIGPIIVLATMRIATAILTAAGLSFLGLGAQPPSPEWGAMLSEGRDYLRTAPYISIIPGLAIMFVVLGFNMLGDGIRDALDTRL
jgi:peptide/nickel transport system permease protein